MADPIFEALRELCEALHEQFPCADNSKLSPRVIKAANEAGLFLLVQPPDDERAERPAQPADWRQICGELLQGLDENRHPEVRYPGHLRLVMAAARTALAAEQGPAALDEVREGFAELERRQENYWRFRDLRTALAVEGPAVPPEGREPAAVAPQGSAATVADGEREGMARLLIYGAECLEAERTHLISIDNHQLRRAAALLRQLAPAPVPEGLFPVEYWHMDSGARIISEPSEERSGGCWVVRNSRHVSPFAEFPTVAAALAALQPPQGGEVAK